MDVVAALLAKSELLYSKVHKTEVMDDEEEEFYGAGLSDYAVSMVSAVVIGQGEEIPEVQSYSGQSEPSRGRAALLDLDDHAKTGKELQADCTEMRPVKESIVPVVERQTGAHPRRGRTSRRYVSRAWVGIKKYLSCCCGRRWEFPGQQNPAVPTPRPRNARRDGGKTEEWYAKEHIVPGAASRHLHVLRRSTPRKDGRRRELARGFRLSRPSGGGSADGCCGGGG